MSRGKSRGKPGGGSGGRGARPRPSVGGSRGGAGAGSGGRLRRAQRLGASAEPDNPPGCDPAALRHALGSSNRAFRRYIARVAAAHTVTRRRIVAWVAAIRREHGLESDQNRWRKANRAEIRQSAYSELQQRGRLRCSRCALQPQLVRGTVTTPRMYFLPRNPAWLAARLTADRVMTYEHSEAVSMLLTFFLLLCPRCSSKYKLELPRDKASRRRRLY